MRYISYHNRMTGIYNRACFDEVTMSEKSDETEEHAERLAKLSKKLGEEMELSEDELDELELVAMLRDIRKISIGKDLLAKVGKLSDADWQEIRKHPEAGYRIANSTSGLSHIAGYILCHHEHWDGSGYPLGLSGADISLLFRIITAADAYDAMTRDRAYRKALPASVAVKEILSHRNSSPQTFTAAYSGGICTGTAVVLSEGDTYSVAVIVSTATESRAVAIASGLNFSKSSGSVQWMPTE